MIVYTSSLKEISPDMLTGFFVNWPNPPSAKTHFNLLKNSNKVVIAIDDNTKHVVGFITAISDGVLSAYIPFLEVLPEYKNKGVGQNLVTKMLKELETIYMVDLCCDDDLVSYYEKFGMMKSNAMLLRNYKMQAGISNDN